MNPSLFLSLQITLIGMGLVFGAIVLLWGLMALLVRLLGERSAVSDLDQLEPARRSKAAIAAVSMALALELDAVPHEFPLPPTAAVSPWQSVMRSKILNKRGTPR